MNWYKIAQIKWIYHNTKTAFLPDIKKGGLESGSFSDRPIDVGGDIWLAIERNVLPERTQEHICGKAIAIEPAWDGFVIAPEWIY